MKAYLTKVHGGRYMVTLFKPIIRTIRGTTHLDAFSVPGEPIDVRHLCAPGIKALLGYELEPMVPTKIELTAVEMKSLSQASEDAQEG